MSAHKTAATKASASADVDRFARWALGAVAVFLCGSLILQASLVDVPGGYPYSTASVALVAAGALLASLPFTRSRTLHLIQAIVGTGALVSAVLWLSQM